ncbi:hypothetical protein PAMP_012304 [Pampus punctatissimus]
MEDRNASSLFRVVYDADLFVWRLNQSWSWRFRWGCYPPGRAKCSWPDDLTAQPLISDQEPSAEAARAHTLPASLLTIPQCHHKKTPQLGLKLYRAGVARDEGGILPPAGQLLCRPARQRDLASLD